MQEIQIIAANANGVISAATVLEVPSYADSPNTGKQGVQGFKVFGRSVHASASGTLQAILVRDSDGIALKRLAGTFAATLLRTGANGASGQYQCDIVWTLPYGSGIDLVDALGAEDGKSHWRITAPTVANVDGTNILYLNVLPYRTGG